MNLSRCGSLWVLLAMALAPAGFSARAAHTNYAGLVYSGNTNVAPQSGIFGFSVSPNQNFSGGLFMGGHHPGQFAGRFDTNGAADTVVEIVLEIGTDDNGNAEYQTQTLWNVHFQLSPAGDSVSGTLHSHRAGIPDAAVFGKRSSFNRINPVPSASRFTFIFPGSGDPANTNFPTGNGFGTIDIGSPGWVDLGGRLADDSSFSEGTVLCDDGTFPMFASLYNGNGMVQGWLGLTNSPDTDLTGDVVWVKPDFARRSFFPAGFTNELAVVGSRYVRTNPVLDWTNGVLIFQGGKLSSPLTNAVLVNAKGAVVNVSNNKPGLKIQLNSGRFNGVAKDPVTGDRILFMGVVLQNESTGFGFFPDAPLSGQVLLAPAGP